MVRFSESEEIFQHTDSSYDIVVVAAKRARQIKDGARPLVEVDSNNPLTVALHEIAAGKVIVESAGESEKQAAPPRERHYLSQRGQLEANIQEAETDENEEE